MRSVLFYIRRMTESRPGWARIRNLLFTLGLAILICGVIGVQRGHAQGTSQSGNAESSAQSSAPGNDTQSPSTSGAQTPSAGGAETPAAAGRGSATDSSSTETGQGSDAESCIQVCAQSSDAESCHQKCTQNREARTPAENGGGQAPSQNSASQVRGARATPAGTDSQSGQSEPQEIQQPSPYCEFALATRPLHANSIGWRQAAAFRQRRFCRWHRERERIADGSPSRSRLCSWAGR